MLDDCQAYISTYHTAEGRAWWWKGQLLWEISVWGSAYHDRSSKVETKCETSFCCIKIFARLPIEFVDVQAPKQFAKNPRATSVAMCLVSIVPTLSAVKQMILSAKVACRLKHLRKPAHINGPMQVPST